MRREHSRLRKEIQKARHQAMAAQQAVTSAQEQANIALSKEMRLRAQLDRLEEEEGEAIAVEERGIQEQEREEQVSDDWVLEPEVINGPNLALSPLTWSALDGFPDSFWEIPNSQTEAVS